MIKVLLMHNIVTQVFLHFAPLTYIAILTPVVYSWLPLAVKHLHATRVFIVDHVGVQRQGVGRECNIARIIFHENIKTLI